MSECQMSLCIAYHACMHNPCRKPKTVTNVTVSELTRPIIAIENRTALEVFDMMSDRIKRALPTLEAEIREECAAVAEQQAGKVTQMDADTAVPVWCANHIAVAIRQKGQP